MEKFIRTKNIETELINLSQGDRPKKPFGRSGRYDTAYGKNNRWRSAIDPQGKWAWLYDWVEGRAQGLVLEGYNGKPQTMELPPLQDVTDQFEALPKATNNHPYLKRKKIEIPKNLDLRLIKGNILVVPVYSKDKIMISWQRIYPVKAIIGGVEKDKLFKEGCTIAGQTPHLVIGEKTEYVFVCEGLATGISIHKMTGMQVYCAFF